MNAVRSEVEELKEKIIKLEEIITQLQSENEFLRANVNRDVLLQLQQQQQLQLQQQALGSPPSQAALPPVQPQQQQPSIWTRSERINYFLWNCEEDDQSNKTSNFPFLRKTISFETNGVWSNTATREENIIFEENLKSQKCCCWFD